MQDKLKLYQTIRNILETKRDPQKFKEYVREMQAKHNVSPSDVFNFLTLKEDIETMGENQLFCLVEAMIPGAIDKHWNKNEIAKLRKWKQSDSRIKFPYDLTNIVEVVPEEQWIGRINISELMKFGDAQMLRYNDNTQRPLQFVHHGTIEYLRPYVNARAEQDITRLFASGEFIPNTLTLQADEDAILNYDPDEHVLQLKSIDHFDILDGYHRYRAILNNHNTNPEWDYPMELRITQFTEDKAKRFIYQENHQTKMKKTAADGLNTLAPENQVVKRLNEDTGFVLGGLIKRNDGIISSDTLSAVIGKCYFDSHSTRDQTKIKSLVLQVARNIKNGIEDICEANPLLIENKWDYKYIYTVIYCVHEERFTGKKLYNMICKVDQQVRAKDVFKANTIISASDTKAIQKILKEV